MVANCYVMMFWWYIWCQKLTISNSKPKPPFWSKMPENISLPLLGKCDRLYSLSKKWKTAFQISPSLLKNRENIFTFSFSSWILEIECPFLFPLSQLERGISNFSFFPGFDMLDSRRWLCPYHQQAPTSGYSTTRLLDLYSYPTRKSLLLDRVVE